MLEMTSSHLQLLFIKVLKPLKWNHLIEAIQESFGLTLYTTREPPLCHQTATTFQKDIYSTWQSEVTCCGSYDETGMILNLIYSSLFSSVTRTLVPSGLRSWDVIFPKISMSTEKYISRPHSSMLLSLRRHEFMLQLQREGSSLVWMIHVNDWPVHWCSMFPLSTYDTYTVNATQRLGTNYLIHMSEL